MRSHSEKKGKVTDAPKSQVNTNPQAQANTPFHFGDKRPETSIQRNFQKMADQNQGGLDSQLFNPNQKAEEGDSISQFKKSVGEKVGSSDLPKGPNDTGLPDQLKSGIENLSGYSMDDVKVHYNSGKPAQLQAHAFAQGTDIHLGSGQEKHLPHEAWHVVQQKQGRVKPTLQMKGGVNVNDDEVLEREADKMGARSMQVGISLPKKNQKTSLVNFLGVSAKHLSPIQGVFTFTNWTDYETQKSLPNHQMSVDEVITNIKGTREAKKLELQKLRDYLTQLDGTVFESREQLINRLRSDTNTGFSFMKRIQFVTEHFGTNLDIINQYFGGIQGWEFKYKLALTDKLGHQDVVKNTIGFLTEIRQYLGKTIARAGVLDMLSKSFTNTWERAPEDYLIGDAKEVLNGFITTILGVNGELETLINSSKIGPEDDEMVFSGSKYSNSDTSFGKIEEDVDVSFVDSSGALNLIETGYSIKALKNKLTGPKLAFGQKPEGQKQRYQYLASSNKVTQEPTGGFSSSMASDRAITAIKLFYSVPLANFDNDIFTPNGLEVISDLIKIDAGLMVGTTRYTPSQLIELKTTIEERIGVYRDRLKELQTKINFNKMSEREDSLADNDTWAGDDEYLSSAEYQELIRLRKILDV